MKNPQPRRATTKSATSLALLACTLTAGCAGFEPPSRVEARVVPAAASSSIVSTGSASSVAKPSAALPAVAVEKPAPAPKAPVAKAERKAEKKTEPRAKTATPEPTRAKAATPQPSRAKEEAKAAAPPPVVAEHAKPAAPAAAERKPEAGLNVSDLTEGLRETHAIGAFTKLALKNQLDDLLQKFRTTHQIGQQPRAAGLRQPFDALVGKVTGLLQSGDPALARKIENSREGIWAILSDPEKFKSVT